MLRGHGGGVRWRAPGAFGARADQDFRDPQGPALAELRAFVAGDSNQQRGECVVLVGGWSAPEGEQAISAEAQRVLDLLLAELPLKRAAALAAEITGCARTCCTNWPWKSRKPSSGKLI